MSAPRTKLSADTRTLIDLFACVLIDQTVTYEQMSKAIGADIWKRRYIVLSALDIVSQDYGALFSSVRGIGYQRVHGKNAEFLSHQLRKSVRSRANRVANKIKRVVEVTNDMPEDAKRQAYREVSVLGLLAHIASDHAVSILPQPAKPQSVAQTAQHMLKQL